MIYLAHNSIILKNISFHCGNTNQKVSGHLASHFKAACLPHGLLEDDGGWNKCLEEARNMQISHQLHSLFIAILLHCYPSLPHFFGILTELKSVMIFIIDSLLKVTLTLHRMSYLIIASISSKVCSWLLKGLFGSILKCPCLNRIGMSLSLTLF